jgi:hypothetical protein
MKFMKRLRVSYLLGLSFALFLSSFLAEHFAMAADLNGFAIRTRDKAVTVTLFSEKPVAYTTERQDRQLTIILSDAKLSKRLIDEGLPVVIDDQNRFIGRAVPSADGKVKIILPNLPAEGYSVSIRQQHGATASSPASAGSTAHSGTGAEAAKSSGGAVLPMHQSPDSQLKPRSAVKTNSKQAFDQMLSKLPVATRSNHPSLVSSQGHGNGVTPPRAVMERLNAPSPMMLTTVEPNAENGGTHPGTIWNPYVVKINPAPMVSETGSDSNVGGTMRLYSASNPSPLKQFEPDPFARLHAIGNSPSFVLPTPPVFPMPNALPSNFHASTPILPPPIVLPTDGSKLTDAKAVAGTEKAGSAASAKGKGSKTSIVTTTTSPSLGSMVRRWLASPAINWLWIALGLFMSGIGLFCLLGSALLGRVLLMKNLSFFRLTPAPVAPVAEAPALQPNPAAYLNQRRPMRPGLGFQDVAVVNALDYTHRSTSSMSDAIKHNPFRERVAARAQVKPQGKPSRQTSPSH